MGKYMVNVYSVTISRECEPGVWTYREMTVMSQRFDTAALMAYQDCPRGWEVESMTRAAGVQLNERGDVVG